MTDQADAPSDRTGSTPGAAGSGGERPESDGADPVASHVHAEAHPPGSESAAAAARDTQYDAVLAAVPAPLAAGAVLAVFSSLSVTLALGAGSLVAAGIVGWALFLAPPA